MRKMSQSFPADQIRVHVRELELIWTFDWMWAVSKEHGELPK